MQQQLVLENTSKFCSFAAGRNYARNTKLTNSDELPGKLCEERRRGNSGRGSWKLPTRGRRATKDKDFL